MDNSEALIIEEAMAVNSKMPMKQIYSTVLCTKNYFFVVPTKTVGMFVIFDTIKNHKHFEGLTISEGIKKMMNESETVADLEEKMKDLLENNENYIYDLNEAKSTKIKGFLGKKTFMYRKPKSWSSFSPKSKAEGKALAEFYPN